MSDRADAPLAVNCCACGWRIDDPRYGVYATCVRCAPDDEPRPAPVPEVERAALTILDQSRPATTDLRIQINRLLGRSEYAEHLASGEVERILRHRHPEIEDAYEREPYRRLMLLREEAIYRLAAAVVSYRQSGRAAEQPTTVRGLGGPVAVLTTSLAAEIANYVGGLANAHAVYEQHLADQIADLGGPL